MYLETRWSFKFSSKLKINIIFFIANLKLSTWNIPRRNSKLGFLIILYVSVGKEGRKEGRKVDSVLAINRTRKWKDVETSAVASGGTLARANK